MTVKLSPAELELLELLVNAADEHPEELFLVAYTNAGTAIVHDGLASPKEWRNDGAALARLDAARLLLVQTYDGGRPKSFYLPSNAREELDEAKRAFEERATAEADRAAAERAGGREPLGLAAALERMIEIQKAHPGGFFTPYDTYPNRSIGYSAVEGQVLTLSHGEFARLLTCGALVKHEQHAGVYHLAPQAGDILAAEQRLQSGGPLATAERRAAMADSRRETSARVAGWLAAAAVVLIFGYLVLNREELFPPGELAGAVYEVVTVVFGATGLALAALSYRLMRRAVRAVLRWWLDPGAPSG